MELPRNVAAVYFATSLFCVYLMLVTSQDAAVTSSDTGDVYACDSPIYCHGKMLEVIQMKQIFDDDKTFVDMPMKEDEEVILAAFEALYSTYDGDIPRTELEHFIEEYFDEVGQELEETVPDDWNARPHVYYKIRDIDLRRWANELNIYWKKLTRQMKAEVSNSSRHSILYVPNKFIIPGGRFREFYYWDTYWIIRGLLISEMKSTARGIIENLLSMVEQYGFVPNGGRIYYTRRTQPPFLTSMMYSYYENTQDYKFVRDNIATLEKEYLFWRDHRTVLVTHDKSGDQVGLARYRADSNTPRPEGYTHDMEAVRHIHNKTERQTMFTNIASAAESGWDFSTRWFHDNHHMKTIKTQDIIPVDLNSMLCATERLLGKLYAAIGEHSKSHMYERSFAVRRDAIHKMLYSERYGVWFDYDITLKKHRRSYFISNFVPLFAQCYDRNDKKLLEKLWYYINDTQILKYKGGVPTSLTLKANKQEQWDYPNAWPPSVHMLIEGLADSNSEKLREMAFEIAQTWTSSNYKGWKKHEAMFEKYDINHGGKRGGGGEYDVQDGFGWTNGVILIILDRFGNNLKAVAGRETLFGLTLEAFVCIVVVLFITGLILTGTIVYLRKKRELEKRCGLTSRDDVQYAPVDTSVVSSHDNHRDNRENELKEEAF